jgi:hypothetical protein
MTMGNGVRLVGEAVMPRRRALAGGAAATLAAARLLAPALFVGCTSGIGPRSRTVPVPLSTTNISHCAKCE